jgi:carbamoyltransferase
MSRAPAACRPSMSHEFERFRDVTGVPMVLSTFLNANKPVLCRPEEALDCPLRTEMDALVIGDVIMLRR